MKKVVLLTIVLGFVFTANSLHAATYDATGKWNYNIYNHTNQCPGGTPAPNENGTAVLIQKDNNTFLLVFTPSTSDSLKTVNGTIAGNVYRYSDRYYEEGGYTYETVTITLSSASSGSGSASWTWSDTCSGGYSISISKQVQSTPSYNASGSKQQSGGTKAKAMPWLSVLLLDGAPADNTAPSAPPGLSASAISSSQINLQWNASSDNVGVTGYKIYRAGMYLKSVTGTAASDSGLSPSTNYCYQVSAYDAAGNESKKSTSRCATTLPPPGGNGPVLTGPETVTSGIGFKLTWTYKWKIFVTNNDGYELQESTTSATSGFTEIWSSKWQNDHQSPKDLIITSRPAGMYYYRVRAYIGQFSKYSDWSNVHQVVVTSDMPVIPNSPSGLAATAISQTQVALKWNDNSKNEDGFRIYRAPRSCTNPFASIGDVGRDVTSETITGLSPGTTACYRVTAFNAAGESRPSNSRLVTTPGGGGDPPTTPTNLQGTFLSLSSVELTWNDSTNEDEYWIAISTVGENGPFEDLPIPISANVTVEPITELAPCTDYWFRVRAKNAHGYSDYSNALYVPIQTAAHIDIRNSYISPLFPGTYYVDCSDLTWGAYDDDGNGLAEFAIREGASSVRVFPRESVLDCPTCATFDLVYGGKYHNDANLVLLVQFNTWSTENRPNFIAVHMKVVGNQVTPVSIWGGDWGNYGDQGIAMIADANIGYNIEGGNLPTVSQNGYLTGDVNGLLALQAPLTGILYSAEIWSFQFHLPLYRDD